jgi:periplasmic divalent cation tolerance protein
MTSIYNWKGSLQKDAETVMIIKTRMGKADDAIAEVRRLHSYENPALVVIPVTGGSETYLSWVRDETAH